MASGRQRIDARCAETVLAWGSLLGGQPRLTGFRRGFGRATPVTIVFANLFESHHLLIINRGAAERYP